MKSIVTTLSIVFAIVGAGASTASAGIVSKLLREATGGGAGRAAREGIESVAGKSVRQSARQGGKAVGRISDDLAAPIVAKFGDDGARAVASLSPKGAERLATMSDDLVAGGRAKEWLGVIAQHGDVAIDWLWERRRSLAVGTVATVALLQPEEFIKATESVATTSINAAGQHIAGPIIGSAAAAFPWTLLWLVLIGLAAAWLTAKKSLTAVFHSLLVAVIQLVNGGPNRARPPGPQDEGKLV
jgi:hypothetical protein